MMADLTAPTIPAESRARLSERAALSRSQARTIELILWSDAQLLIAAVDSSTDPDERADYHLAAEQASKAAQMVAGAYMDGLDYDQRLALLHGHAQAASHDPAEAALIRLLGVTR